MTVNSTFSRLKHIGLYSLLFALLVFALKWLQWKYLIADYSLDIYVGLIALFFTLLGIWAAGQLVKTRVKTVVVEKPVYTVPEEGINRMELEKLGLTNREYEVLQRLSKGCSNAEIAEELFLSLSTVKTHVSNLFLKMEVKSRAQAIEKSKRLKLTE